MKATGSLIVMMGATLGLTAFVAINQGQPAESDAEARLAAVETRLARMETLLEEVRDTGRSVKRRVESAPRASSSATTLPSSAAPGALGALGAEASAERVTEFENEVASRVETAVTKKIEEMAALTRHRGADGKWKPPMGEMAKALSIDAQKEEALREVFDGARDELFAVLNERRPEGGSLLDQFAADISESGDIEAATKRFFGRMTQDKLPGSDQTYINALFEVGARVQTRIDAQLDEAGRRRFRELNVDVFEVQTGHDPVGDYIRSRLETTD